MKHYLLILFCFCTLLCFPQRKKIKIGQLNFGITNGITSSNDYPSDYYTGIRTSSFCFAAGLRAPMYTGKKFIIYNAVLFKKSGDKSLIFPIDPLRGWWFERQFSYKLFGIEDQINLELKLNKKTTLIFGGSFMYYLWGKRILYNLSDDTKIKEKIPKSDIKRYGLTLNFGISIIESIQPYIQYDFISTKTTNDPIFIESPRNYLSIGIKLDLEFVRGL